jgi:chromosome segregation ATPase
MEWLLAITAAINAAAAVLAWVAKIRWSKEYKEAKEAQIDLLDREIRSLRELNPPVVRESFIAMREQLEDYNDTLKVELEEKDKAIVQLRASGKKHVEQLSELESERDQLATFTEKLEDQLEEARSENAKYFIIVASKRVSSIDSSGEIQTVTVPSGINYKGFKEESRSWA